MGREETYLNIRKAIQDNPQQSFFLYVHALPICANTIYDYVYMVT